MKLAALLALSVLAAGCTKKPTPEYDASVRAWQSEACACYRTADDLASCGKNRLPYPELNAVEQLMVNAGVLTDGRRESYRSAEETVRSCAQAGAARSAERRDQSAIDDSLKNIRNLNLNLGRPLPRSPGKR